MKCALINGSPKKKDSATGAILNMVKKDMDQASVVELKWGLNEDDKQLENMVDCDVYIIAFPLYIDCVPSHVLRWMKKLEVLLKKHGDDKKRCVFAISNCGFYEPFHNLCALEVMEHWCEHIGATFGGGLAVGGGGMIASVYATAKDNGPLKPISVKAAALGRLAMSGGNQGGQVVQVKPAFPYFMYKGISHNMWKNSAKLNGITVQDLYVKTWDK